MDRRSQPGLGRRRAAGGGLHLDQLPPARLRRVALRRLEAVGLRQGARHRGPRLLHGDQVGRGQEGRGDGRQGRQGGARRRRGDISEVILRMIEMPEWYNASVLVDRNLEAGRADKIAIHSGDERVTYGGLARRINRLGHALREIGVDREDRVLLNLNDTPAFPTAFFAAMRIGAIPIPVNTLLKADDYRYFIENSRARVVVCDGMHHETIRKALEGYDEERVEVVVTGGQAEGAHALEDLLEAGEDELAPAATHKDDPAFWLYSSGSTGKPKGAVHLHHDIIYTCETYASHVLEVSQDDVCFSASKLFHAYGLGNGI